MGHSSSSLSSMTSTCAEKALNLSALKGIIPVDAKASWRADGAILESAASNNLENSCQGIIVAPLYPSDVVMAATFFFRR